MLTLYNAVHGQLGLKRSKRIGDVQADTKEAGICRSKRGHDQGLIHGLARSTRPNSAT